MSRAVQLSLFVLAAMSASGCEAIAGIFKAGVWVGVILVALIVIAIVAIARAVRRT